MIQFLLKFLLLILFFVLIFFISFICDKASEFIYKKIMKLIDKIRSKKVQE